MKSLAQINYEAYCEARSWKAFNGETLRQWDQVEEPIKVAWEYAAKQVLRAIRIADLPERK